MRRTLTGALAFGALAGALTPFAARAEEPMSDTDSAALSLADAEAGKPAEPVVARPWKFFVQDAVRESGYRDQPSSLRNQASVDLTWQKALTPELGAKFSGRFDSFDPLSSAAASHRGETTVREAYATWSVSPVSSVDAGRVDERQGAAFGYNPSDYFRAGAVDLDVSPDPESRRTNRLGTMAVRAQRVWASGSAQLLYSPRLTGYSAPGNPYASSDWQRTNGANRGLLVLSQRVSATVQPQLLVYEEEKQAPQIGFNVSVVPTSSIVAYAEWSGGRRASLIGRATGQDDRAFRASSAVGASWTTPLDLTFIAEAQTNGAGSTPAQWRSLQASNMAGWGTAVQASVSAQELPTRYGAFFMANWRNAGMRRLDMSAFVQVDQGGGRQVWGEVRRHFDRFDVALQVQKQSGPSWDRYGAMRESRSVQLLAQFFR